MSGTKQKNDSKTSKETQSDQPSSKESTSSTSHKPSGWNPSIIQSPTIKEKDVQKPADQSSSTQVSFNPDFSPGTLLGNQQNDLVFHLNWSTKIELVSHLNDFSTFLVISDKKARSDELKKKLVKQNSDLLSALASLPLVSTKRKLDKLADKDVSNEDKLIVKLSWSARGVIVNHLFNNVSCGLLDEFVMQNETKLNLIYQNNKTIMLLLKLPIDRRLFCKTATGSDANEPEAKKRKGSFHSFGVHRARRSF